jgi:anti-sigma factor RsiW
MDTKLNQLIAYRDGELDESERKVIEQKLKESPDFHARYEALEHLAGSLKSYFDTHPPEKAANCPEESLWARYLNDELDAQEQAGYMEHLQECDYCFDIAASLKKEQMQEATAQPLRPPEWLRQRADASDQRTSLQNRWADFVRGLGQTWAGLVTPRKWAYATAGLATVILLAGLFVWQEYYSTDLPGPMGLPGQSIQLADNTYQLLALPSLTQPEDLPEDPEEWQNWYSALIEEEQPRSVVALMTSSLAEALRMVMNSQQRDGTKRVIAELDAQVVKLPSEPIAGILMEQEIAQQILQKNYRLNEHLLITFLTSEKDELGAQTILRIEAEQ